MCRLEQQGVERYLDNQFYENVNSLSWREHLRSSQGFCHEHAWLAVNKRLGDALGFSIIYHDIVNSILRSWNDDPHFARTPRRRTSILGQGSDGLRRRVKAVLAILSPRKSCPACAQREELASNILSALLADLPGLEMREALQASEGLCLPHLRLVLGYANEDTAYETLLVIHREKLESLKEELAEFIRKNDYQTIKEGFGSEGNAWLRAIGLIVGSRKDRSGPPDREPLKQNAPSE